MGDPGIRSPSAQSVRRRSFASPGQLYARSAERKDYLEVSVTPSVEGAVGSCSI